MFRAEILPRSSVQQRVYEYECGGEHLHLATRNMTSVSLAQKASWVVVLIGKSFIKLYTHPREDHDSAHHAKLSRERSPDPWLPRGFHQVQEPKINFRCEERESRTSDCSSRARRVCSRHSRRSAGSHCCALISSSCVASLQAARTRRAVKRLPERFCTAEAEAGGARKHISSWLARAFLVLIFALKTATGTRSKLKDRRVSCRRGERIGEAAFLW